MVDNQHKKIVGYNDLSLVEIDLMNDIKAHEKSAAELVARVMAFTKNNWEAKLDTIGITDAETEYCQKQKNETEQQQILAVNQAEHFYMRLIRSVAHPDSPWLNIFDPEKKSPETL